jgi:ABC-type Fe3+-hydroxamate transport system substrate-binding protein
VSGLRALSLVPSVTESLLAWGVVPVGVTRFCEQPALPQVGGTKNPDLAAILELAPDLVVVNDEENRREDAEALEAAGLRVHSCSPRSVAEVGPAMEALAVAVGLSGVPSEVPGPAGSGTGSGLDELVPLGRRAFVPIWRRPWMTISPATYGASLLVSIGVEVVPVLDDADDRYPTVELAAVASAAPDVVLAPSEPYAFKPFHLDVLRSIAPVVEVDGQDLFWWGVRTPTARQRLHRSIGEALSG